MFRLPRFYPILDVQTVRARGLETLSVAREILDAGAGILQFRNKGAFTKEIAGEVERVCELCRESGAILIVNDRADVARLVEAGVHLGQQDLRPREVRAMVGERAPIGFSTHNEAQFREALAEPADYLAFGPIFATRTKENPDPVVGLDQLRTVRALADRPLVAIGGITRQNARSVIEAGADSVAVISDLYLGEPVRRIVQHWLSLLGPDS